MLSRWAIADKGKNQREQWRLRGEWFSEQQGTAGVLGHSQSLGCDLTPLSVVLKGLRGMVFG